MQENFVWQASEKTSWMSTGMSACSKDLGAAVCRAESRSGAVGSSMVSVMIQPTAVEAASREAVAIRDPLRQRARDKT